MRRGGNILIRLRSDPSELAPARHAVENLAAEIGFDTETAGKIGLCVNEAMANIIRHAYSGRIDQPIELSAEPVEGGLKILLRDWGNGVDPSSLPPKPHDPLQPGGLGLICLREMMDEVHFQPQKPGMCLTLIKKLERTP
jgi:serine/threonine-protein kinase RsbW